MPRVRVKIMKSNCAEVVYTYCIEFCGKEVCYGGIVGTGQEFCIESEELAEVTKE